MSDNDMNVNDTEETIPLAEEMNELGNYDPIPSTINNAVNQNSTLNNSTIMNLNNELKEKKSPYQYKDKIPEISIRDENKLANGENIETYINCAFNPNFDDNIYNICENCRKNNNYFFCEKCSKNLCIICSSNCDKEHKNKLKKLMQDEIESYKSKIEKIINEYFIKPKKKEENYEKEQKSYQVIDENKINDEPFENFEKYTNDIVLINLIIHSNFKNYFHYKNIKNCYNYMKMKYDIDVQISIEYEIKSKETKIRIFGNDFVKNNKGKCFIIYEEKLFELMTFFELKDKINNNILKIKLIGIKNITNINSMFLDCFSLISLPDISKWNTNNVTNMNFIM